MKMFLGTNGRLANGRMILLSADACCSQLPSEFLYISSKAHCGAVSSSAVRAGHVFTRIVAEHCPLGTPLEQRQPTLAV